MVKKDQNDRPFGINMLKNLEMPLYSETAPRPAFRRVVPNIRQRPVGHATKFHLVVTS
jgi:hypothetical protein